MMSKRSCLVVGSLLILLAVMLAWMRSPSGSSQSASAKPDSETLRPEAPSMAPRAIQFYSEAETARRSPKDWTPPAVFSEPNTPTPRIPVIRGPQASRIYNDPVTRELNEHLAKNAPVVLANSPVDGRFHLLPEEMREYTLLARRMVLDTSALDSVLNGGTSRILAPTTNDEVLTLNIHSIRTRSEHSHTLIGEILGEHQTSSVHLVYHDGIIHGSVSRYNTSQHIEYLSLMDDHMMVREIDMSTLSMGCETCEGGCNHEASADELINEAHGVEVEIQNPSEPEIAAETAGYTTIDVVVGYGQSARIDAGGYAGIEGRILAAVDMMTTAFGNSGITNSEVMLLGTIEDPDYVLNGSNSSSMGDELDDLSDPSGSNPNLNTVTDFGVQVGADLISFVIRNGQGGTAGLAQRPGVYSINSSSSMVGGGLVFAHELGHNLGCDHSWGDSNQDYKTNYGWRFTGDDNGKYRTIMSYDGSWSRIPHYSNPSINYEGQPTGAGPSTDVDNTSGDPDLRVGGYDALPGGPDNFNLDPNKVGFDGSRADLAANNADGILNGTGGSSYGATFASNRRTRASNAVIFPNASTTWNAGDTETILFVGGDGSDDATIELYRGGQFVSTIDSSVNPGESKVYRWDIPSNLLTGSDYTIRVTITYSGGGSDMIESDDFAIFGVDAGGVELLSPNGGETYTRSTVEEITWESSLGGNVKIDLLKNGLEIDTLVASTPNDGSFDWTISKDLTADTDYKILITSLVDPGKTDQSTADFTLLDPTTILMSENMDTDPGFTVSGDFEYGTPSGSNLADTAYTGTKIYDTVLDATSYGASSLTSYAIDCSNHQDIELEFWYHSACARTIYFEVSNDGSSWTILETLPGAYRNSWRQGKYDISSVADGQSAAYIRWRVDSGAEYGGGGLAIDDVMVSGTFIPADDIELVSPNGTETLTREIPETIQWVSGIGGNVKIELLKSGSLVRTIVESTPNDGSFTTVLPSSVTAAGDYRVRISSLLILSTSTTSASNFTIVAPSSTVYSENFNSDPEYSTTGLFEYGVPAGNNRPASAYSGTNIYDTDLDETCFTNSTLTSIPIDCSNHTSINLSFRYHAYIHPDFTYTFEVSNDNSNWSTLTSQSGAGVNSWQLGNYDISAIADGEPTVYIRWSMTGSGFQYGGSGLAIDDVTITGTFAPSSFGYDITYNGGGGTSGNPPAPGTKQQGVNVTLSDSPGTLAKSGYYLTGWNTQLNGSGTPYALGATYSANANLTLYAQWGTPPYELWAGGPAPEVDSNDDGVSNGLAWVLGAANPSADASAMRPTLDNDSDPDFFIFTHRRSDDALNDPNTSITVEYGSDLTGWTEAVHDGTDVIISVTNDVDPGVDEVEVKLRRTLSNFGRFFSRLRADFSN